MQNKPVSHFSLARTRTSAEAQQMDTNATPPIEATVSQLEVLARKKSRATLRAYEKAKAAYARAHPDLDFDQLLSAELLELIAALRESLSQRRQPRYQVLSRLAARWSTTSAALEQVFGSSVSVAFAEQACQIARRVDFDTALPLLTAALEERIFGPGSRGIGRQLEWQPVDARRVLRELPEPEPDASVDGEGTQHSDTNKSGSDSDSDAGSNLDASGIEVARREACSELSDAEDHSEVLGLRLGLEVEPDSNRNGNSDADSDTDDSADNDSFLPTVSANNDDTLPARPASLASNDDAISQDSFGFDQDFTYFPKDAQSQSHLRPKLEPQPQPPSQSPSQPRPQPSPPPSTIAIWQALQPPPAGGGIPSLQSLAVLDSAHVTNTIMAGSHAPTPVPASAIVSTALLTQVKDVEYLRPGRMLNETVIFRVLALLSAAQHSWQVVDPILVTSSTTAATVAVSFPTEHLVLPLHHQSAKHWTLAIYDISANRVVFFDPLPSSAHLDEAKFKLHVFFSQRCCLDATGWFLSQQVCPRQPNTFDCGVYILAAAFCIAAGQTLPATFDGELWRAFLTCLCSTDPCTVERPNITHHNDLLQHTMDLGIILKCLSMSLVDPTILEAWRTRTDDIIAMTEALLQRREQVTMRRRQSNLTSESLQKELKVLKFERNEARRKQEMLDLWTTHRAAWALFLQDMEQACRTHQPQSGSPG